MTDTDEELPESEIVAKRRPDADDPHGITDADIQSKDGFLDLLMSLYIGFDDSWEGAIGMTIQSQGAVISGTVISRVEWSRRVVEELRNGGGGEAADRLGQLYDKTNNRLLEEWKDRDEQDLLGRARRFIHMRDARIINGNIINVPLWRGSLADVTGWSLGSYSDD